MRNEIEQVSQPLRSVSEIEKVRSYFRKTNHKTLMLFHLGIYSGLRVSDILELRVSDVMGDYISVKEKKTKKSKRFPIIPQLRKALDGYIRKYELEGNNYLIFTEKNKDNPISRVQAWRLLQDDGKIEKELGITHFSPHSLRKTFLRRLYDLGVPTMELLAISNHDSEKDLKKYIAIEQDEIDKNYMKIDY